METFMLNKCFKPAFKYTHTCNVVQGKQFIYFLSRRFCFRFFEEIISYTLHRHFRISINYNIQILGI